MKPWQKFILFVIASAIIASTEANLNNFTILATYPDGQPKLGKIPDEVLGTDMIVQWNSYGQAILINGEPSLVSQFEKDLNTDELYVYRDENGELVSFEGKLIGKYDIPSNKIPHKPLPFREAGMNAKEYQTKFNVSRTYMQNATNYQVIYDNLYTLTPGGLDERLKEQGGYLTKIRDWIELTFGIKLW